jgi:hypothetical protein
MYAHFCRKVFLDNSYFKMGWVKDVTDVPLRLSEFQPSFSRFRSVEY